MDRNRGGTQRRCDLPGASCFYDLSAAAILNTNAYLRSTSQLCPPFEHSIDNPVHRRNLLRLLSIDKNNGGCRGDR